MTTDPSCLRLGKWIRGCRFEPRYDLGEPDLSRFTDLSGPSAVAFVEALKPSTYVCDVCVTCGKVIERTPSPNHQSEGSCGLMEQMHHGDGEYRRG